MPYIPEDTREKVLRTNDSAVGGELAFQFLHLARRYIASKGDSVNYNSFADVIAALEVAKFIFQDEDVRAYESFKRRENGDV